MSLYEILLIGDVSADQRTTLTATISAAIEQFDLRIGRDVAIRDARSISARDLKASVAAAFFVGKELSDVAVASRLLDRGVPMIPIVDPVGSFEVLPPNLRVPNGIRLNPADPQMEVVAAAILESIGLLRQQRRVFVSYRRAEARGAALQLHDMLAGRGFDVFLDTHDIRPGEPFQETLWHRMTDSDVVIVLDTATYFQRRWTREEFGKAMAREIHILRLVWPGRKPTEHLSIGEMIKLSADDLTARKTLRRSVADKVIVAVERIRSRSIAARLRSLTGKLRAEATRIGARVEGIGGHHSVALKLSRGRRVWAYPAVGVPTANSLYEAAERVRSLDEGLPVLVYDHVGISEGWLKHLSWLDENIAAVDAIKVFDAGSRLVELDD